MFQRQLRVCFGEFEMDEHAGELRKEGIKVHLQEQPLQILRILLEHPGEVVMREDLRKRVWPTDTFVDFDHGINNAIKRLREALGDTAETPRFVETLPRRGYRFIANLEPTKVVAGARIQSVAVLPLENLSRDPEQEYFADGMTEALITSLAKISALRVISRTTVMHYKGVRRPLPEIAREIGVQVVVEGTVLRSGEKVRISVQLIETSSDTHLWAESYERDLRDILRLQSEISRAVAQEIQAKLTPAERERLTRSRSVSPEAYELYLRGRHYWNMRNAQGFTKGAEYFLKAISVDPNYAAAYGIHLAGRGLRQGKSRRNEVLRDRGDCGGTYFSRLGTDSLRLRFCTGGAAFSASHRAESRLRHGPSVVRSLSWLFLSSRSEPRKSEDRPRYRPSLFERKHHLRRGPLVSKKV